MLKAIILAILSFPVYREDVRGEEKRGQLEAIAQAVASVTKNPDEAAFLLAWGNAETNFSLRIHRGECNQWECDGGRARGPWQAHRNGMNEERWSRMVGVENVQVQAEQAVQHARFAFHACPTNRIRGAFRILAGRACTSPIKDEEARMAAYNRVRRQL